MLTQEQQIKRAERTRMLIDHYNEKFGHKAWGKLHGILCMTHPFNNTNDRDQAHYNAVDLAFDGIMLAEELDRQNAEAAREVQR